MAAVLGAFSQRKLRKLGWLDNGEVVLSAGAPVAGHGGWHRHSARRSRGGA
jgi:hypothetical protein